MAPNSSDVINVINYRYGRPLGVIFPDGALWKEQRRFVGRSLKKINKNKNNKKMKIKNKKVERAKKVCWPESQDACRRPG